MEIIPYTSDRSRDWDRHVLLAECGTFMLYRGYMDYHSHRFTDHSLMAVDGDKILGVLPANRVGNTLYSHQGLTFGGWVTSLRGMDPERQLHMWQLAIDHLRSQGIDTVIYKPRPWIYSTYPNDDDLYALFRLGAILEASSISAAIDLREPRLISHGAQLNSRKALRGGIKVALSTDFETFWHMLNERLNTRYGVSPVHSVEELQLLHSRFPENIQLFMAYNGDKPVAGILMYLSRQVAHSQYIATTDEGRRLNVLWLLVDEVIASYCGSARFFDFGISCEDGGRILNAGLAAQKYGMGGRGVVYSTYRISL